MDLGSLVTLTGHYQLRPGQTPGVQGQRPVLGAGRLGRLLRGQRARQVGQSLSSVFSLCAHAHRRVADMTMAAASTGLSQVPSPAAEQMHLLDTARDHLRTLALEWPLRAGLAPQHSADMQWLAQCPLNLGTQISADDAHAASAGLNALHQWLEQQVLRCPVRDWELAHVGDLALAVWCQEVARRLLPARCLIQWQPVAQRLTLAGAALNPWDAPTHEPTQALRELGAALAAHADFVQQPQWRGQCAETGPWSRHSARVATPAGAPVTVWGRLASRWRELLAIARQAPSALATARPALLQSGAVPLAPGQALGWSEMARGLLLHWVRVDDQAAVLDYRVLAPTEWNFHPQGSLSRAIASLSRTDGQAAQVLAAAFDPCVPCVLAGTPALEPSHA